MTCSDSSQPVTPSINRCCRIDRVREISAGIESVRETGLCPGVGLSKAAAVRL